jgi:hypothetical protein
MLKAASIAKVTLIIDHLNHEDFAFDMIGILRLIGISILLSRLRTNIPLFASAGDLLHPFPGQSPGCAPQGRCRDQKASFALFRSTLFGQLG